MSGYVVNNKCYLCDSASLPGLKDRGAITLMSFVVGFEFAQSKRLLCEMLCWQHFHEVESVLEEVRRAPGLELENVVFSVPRPKGDVSAAAAESLAKLRGPK